LTRLKGRCRVRSRTWSKELASARVKVGVKPWVSYRVGVEFPLGLELGLGLEFRILLGLGLGLWLWLRLGLRWDYG
jgi:hypothetical protein